MSAPTGTPQHERKDIEPSSISYSFIALVAFLIGCVAVAAILHNMYSVRQPRTVSEVPPIADVPSLTPRPSLQASPWSDWHAFASAEKQRTTTYQWIDREKGLVQLPIERAKELVLKKGLPVRPGVHEEPR